MWNSSQDVRMPFCRNTISANSYEPVSVHRQDDCCHPFQIHLSFGVLIYKLDNTRKIELFMICKNILEVGKIMPTT